MEKKRKFYITKNTTIWAVIATAISLIAYILVLVFIEQKDEGAAYGFYVARDVLLVVFTVFVTTLLTGFLVEVRTKNELYADTILQDVFANPMFYKAFSEDAKRMMLDGLERELLFSENSSMQNMYGSIKKKLSDVENDGYYYEDCNYHVSCQIENGLIIKKVSRTIRLRSYGKHHTIRNLVVLNWSGLEYIEKHFDLKQVKIDSEPLPKEKYRIDSTVSPRDTESFCGYTVSYQCQLIEDIELSSDADTVISVLYETRVPLSDNLYTCRSKVPCRHFEVSVNLENSPEYKLNAVAFGFLDTAKRSPDCVNDHEVRVVFDDWIFSKDGVTVAIAPKEEAAVSKSVKKMAKAF